MNSSAAPPVNWTRGLHPVRLIELRSLVGVLKDSGDRLSGRARLSHHRNFLPGNRSTLSIPPANPLSRIYSKMKEDGFEVNIISVPASIS